MNSAQWAVLGTVGAAIVGLVGILIGLWVNRPKQKAETVQAVAASKKTEVDIENLKLSMTKMMVEQFEDQLKRNQAELDKWKAEFNVQAAIHAEREAKSAERERRLVAENAELRELVRQAAEREKQSTRQRAAILDMQITLEKKLDIQAAATEGFRKEMQLIRAALDSMEPKKSPSKDPVVTEVEQ